jgi:hypothetical protein
MAFILVPKHGEDVRINAWNWRPTLELLRAEGIITADDYERMGAHGCGGQADAELALRIAEVIDRRLSTMGPKERMRADLTITAAEKQRVAISPVTKVDDVDVNEAYSATYEWLVIFRDFCRTSGGFEIL